VAVLVQRRRRAPARRRSVAALIDSFLLGLVMVALLFVIGSFEIFTSIFKPFQRATLGVIGIAPIAFLVGLLDARLARSAVGELVINLRRDPTPRALQAGLSRALHDPSLTVAYWLPEYETYADLDGRPVNLEALATGKATRLIERDGARVAALVHDQTLEDEPELLDAVTAAAGIALENGQLQAELRARLEELAGSRARVIEAGQKERQRLERNLHDGAQQRLIALSLGLSRLEKRLGHDPAARWQLDDAQREITLSLEELRDVSRGLHPAVVTAHGLAVALEQVAARAPLPVRLCVDVEERLPEPIEVAAYYVVSESLTNVAKHAQATTCAVTVRHAADQLVVEVVDNGIGGADSERGSGLRGLADRVEALGGRLRVWTPHGGGTRVRAELPCA
jgi:signal transduction histidine kinase